MVDSRFFSHSGPFSLAELAELTGATLSEDKDSSRKVIDVAPLDRAGPNEISFLDNTKYLDVFAASKAGACIVRQKFASRAPAGMALLFSEEPYRAYALIACKFYPAHTVIPGRAAQAVVDDSATIGDGSRIEPFAVIGPGVKIGKSCSIGAHTVIGKNVEIGDDCFIGAGTTLENCLIGSRAIIHPGVHIGQDGFGFALGRDGHVKVPQLGRVLIEDDVEIGAGTCIDRGTGPDTVIGRGTKIDNLVQIAHNVHIGQHCVIVAQSGIAGSTRIGDGVVLGGQAGISGHIKIGSGARIAAQSGVITDVPAGASWGGYPASPVHDWHRQTIALSRMIRKKDGAKNS